MKGNEFRMNKLPGIIKYIKRKLIVFSPLFITIAIWNIALYVVSYDYQNRIKHSFDFTAYMEASFIQILEFMITPEFWLINLTAITLGILTIFITKREKGETLFNFIVRMADNM